MGYIGQFDQVILRIVDMLPSAMHAIMLFITFAGSPPVCIVILGAAILLAYKHGKKRLMYAEIALLLAVPLGLVLKEITRRVRPDTTYVHGMLIKSYSFPSIHAYVSLLVFGFCMYLVMKRIKSPMKWLCVFGLGFLIVLVGVSRIFLGAHYPSDVFGGWILGLVVLALVIKFSNLNAKPIKSK